jgi:hypothetical protein
MSTLRPVGAGLLFNAINYKHFVLTGLVTPAILTCCDLIV